MRKLNLIENLRLIYGREDLTIEDVLNMENKKEFVFFCKANGLIQRIGFLDIQNMRACARDCGIDFPERIL